MKFCNDCESRLTKTTNNNDVVFSCLTCGSQFDGSADDSLMYEEFLEITESTNTKYDDFIKGSAFDTAGNKVRKQCSQCKSPFMTLLRVGERETALYTCTCGFKLQHGAANAS